jgi:hypothetical protein
LARNASRCCVCSIARSVLTMGLGRLRTAAQQSHCFFRCAVVNEMQCRSIPDRTNATPAMLHG